MKHLHKFAGVFRLIALAIVIVVAAAAIVCLSSLFSILDGKECEFVLSIIGIIATFIVISNYAQYDNIKKEVENRMASFEQFKRSFSFIIEKDKKFIFAQKLFLQNELAEDEKDEFIVKLKPNYVKCNGTYDATVKIKSISVENNKLKLISCNPEVNLDNVICIGEEDVFNSENDYSCNINDPTLIAFIECLTKEKELQEQKNN